MNALVDKTQVEKQFSRAATGYDSASGLQKAMSEQLIKLLIPYTKDKNIDSITDLGCGTGLSLIQLAKQFPGSELNAVDISSTMLGMAKNNIDSNIDPALNTNYVCADMEKYQASGPQNIIFANASIQWCDLNQVLNKVYHSLQQGGFFAFSSFGPKTHCELASAWQQVDGRQHRIDFLNTEEHLSCLTRSGFTVLEQRSEVQVLPFENAQTLLNSIKQTGATDASSARERGLLSRERYRQFLSRLSANNPLQLSYEILNFVATKPTSKY